MSKQYEVGFRLSTSGSAEVVRDVGMVGQGFERVGDVAGSIMGKVRDLAIGLAGAFTVKEFVQTADEMALLDARLKLATKSEREYADARAATYRIAQENNVALEATTTLYNKLADPVRKLGGGVRETSAIVESFSAALRVGGASAAESSAATLQFAQAMASGALRGDEFNSIAEASPRFMRALAESLGVSTGELRDMAEKGKLTADVVGNALVGSIGALRAEAAQMPDTVGGAMTRLANDVRLAVADLNSNSGITLGIADLVDMVRQLVPTIKSELGGAFKSVGDWINDNREQLGEVWETVKSLTADVWTGVKAFGSMLGFVADLVIGSGALKTMLEGVRLTIALARDGVELLGGYFAIVGSKILQGVLSPLNLVLKASASIAGVFDEELASKIRGVAQGIDDFAKAGEGAGRQVFQRFQEGRSHTAALGAEMASTAAKNAQLKAALDGSGMSAAENSRELQRLTSNAAAASGGFTKLAGATKEDEEAKKATSKAAKELQKDLERQGDLLAELSGLNRDYADKVKDLVAMYARGEFGLERFNVLHDALLAKQPFMIAQTKAAIEAGKEQNKLFDEAFEAMEKKRLGEEAQIKTARTMLEQLEAEAAALKMTTLQRALATAERELERQGIVKGTVAYEAYIEKIRAAVLNKETVQQSLDAAKQVSEGWNKFAEDLYGSVSDSLMRGAEDGKGFFDGLADTVKGMFRNLVLTPTIRAVMGGMGGSLASGLASASGATLPAADASGGGLGQLASVASSLFGAGGLGGSLAAGAGWLTGATTLTGSLTAAGSLIGTGTMGGVASGLGMAAGALGPIAIGVALAATLLSKKRGGPKDSGSAGIGDAYRYADSGGLDEILQGVLDGTNASYAQTAAALGVDAKTIAGTQFGLFAARDPQGTALTQLVAESKVNGQQTYFRNGENVGRSDADLEKAIADSTANAVLASLQASGIDQDARAYLESKAALGGSADQINKLLTTLVDVKTAFADIDTLGGVFGRISVLSIDAKAQLLAFSGGVEAFLAKTRAYVDQYFSEAEKAAITAQDVLTRLEAAGISTDLTTKDSLRALVESTDETTESGRQQLAVLLDVADEFASISDYLASQGKTLDELAALAPKSDLIAKLTDEGNSATKDTAEGVLDLGATTQAVGDALQSSIVTLDSNSDTRNAQLVAAIDAQSARLEELVDVQMVSSAQQVSGLTNLRKSFEDLTVGVLRVQVID